MLTVRDWEDYIDMEEELHLEEVRKKFHQKKKSHDKQEWDKLETKTNKKGYKKNGKQRDKKNSWTNHPNRI